VLKVCDFVVRDGAPDFVRLEIGALGAPRRGPAASTGSSGDPGRLWGPCVSATCPVSWIEFRRSRTARSIVPVSRTTKSQACRTTREIRTASPQGGCAQSYRSRFSIRSLLRSETGLTQRRQSVLSLFAWMPSSQSTYSGVGMTAMLMLTTSRKLRGETRKRDPQFPGVQPRSAGPPLPGAKGNLKSHLDCLVNGESP
jgi:hypothetical protein